MYLLLHKTAQRLCCEAFDHFVVADGEISPCRILMFAEVGSEKKKNSCWGGFFTSAAFIFHKCQKQL